MRNVRLKPDKMRNVRLKPDKMQNVRLKPDSTRCGTSGLKPDSTQARGRVRLQADNSTADRSKTWQKWLTMRSSTATVGTGRPSSRSTDVTPRSAIPHGTMRLK